MSALLERFDTGFTGCVVIEAEAIAATILMKRNSTIIRRSLFF